MTAEATVCVVDDDVGARKSVRAPLQSSGLAVETYAWGKEFLLAYNPERLGSWCRMSAGDTTATWTCRTSPAARVRAKYSRKITCVVLRAYGGAVPSVQGGMAMDVDRYLTGVPIDLFRPHVILPAQHFNPPKKLAPEHRLMMAVLDDALRCVEKYRCPTDDRGRRLFHAAKQWLFAAEPHWPYSFERICAVLDLDANAVRHRLRLAPERPPVSVSREMRTRTHQRGIVDVVTSDTAVGGAAGIRSHTPPRRPSRRTANPTFSAVGTPHVATQTE
jgi:hypothetical protein